MGMALTVRRVFNEEVCNSLGESEIRLVRQNTIPGHNDNNVQNSYDTICDSEIKQALLEAWNSFHEGYNHSSFSTIYSKWRFCEELDMNNISGNKQEMIIRLLSDRYFLFLEYNRMFNNFENVPLSEIAQSPMNYSEKERTPDEAFIPTQSHNAAYKTMLKNEEELERAIKLRVANMGIKHIPAGLATKLIYKNVDVEEKYEELISKLFWDYICASKKYAHVSKYGELLNVAKENQNAGKIGNELSVIRWLLHELRTNNVPIEYWPVAVFLLLSQYTSKLVKGHVKSFEFKKIERRSNKFPEDAQEPERAKNEINIMLFDYLCSVILSEEASEQQMQLSYKANLLFYLFTGYNGYCHYKIPKFIQDFEFNEEPLPKEGVDQLGSIIRYNIFYCIPNQCSSLIPGLPNDPVRDADALSTYLLRDATYFSAYMRLTDKIRRCLSGDKGKDIVDLYSHYQPNQHDTLEFLDEVCAKNRLYFVGENVLYDAQTGLKDYKKLCSRLALEFALKEKRLRGIRDRLSEIAQELWGDLLFEGETFAIPEKKR